MQVIERILHMLRVKDCRHVCLFCEYYDMCKQETGSRKEVKENEHEICNEDTEQINVVSWANWNMNRYPELKWLHHVPNGGSRNKQEAVKLKQMGVKAGVSDLCLPYPKGLYCGLYIEMKFGDNRQQETQKEFLADMAAAGHFVATCYSAEEAVKVIEEYCKLMNHKMGDCEIVIPLENREELRNITMSIPNNSILKNGEIKESKPRKK